MTPEEVVTQAGIEGLTVASLGDWDGLKAAVAKGGPAVLTHLKDAGMTKLPDRQKLRDVINEIANPPKGSEDDLREQCAPRARLSLMRHAL